MSTATPTPAAFPLLAFRRVADGAHDGNRVYVSGPFEIEREAPFVLNGIAVDDGYDRVRALPGAFVLYEDRGDHGPCALDPFSDGHRHSGYRMEADGSRTWLPSCGSFRAVKIAAAALAAGFDPRGPEARSMYWQERNSARKARRGGAR